MGSIELILTGFTIVIGVLSFLWFMCLVVGFLHKDRKKKATTMPEPAGPAPTPVPSAHLAAISAAVAEMVPGKYRIVRVYAPGHKAYGWAEEGRYQLTSSHRVRWDWATPGPVSPSIVRNKLNNGGNKK
ncbi:MAG: OadG family protein [Gammaproteobacteria bacterium]|nr:OadG family protein [Gammaproteobacteria bacterium]